MYIAKLSIKSKSSIIYRQYKYTFTTLNKNESSILNYYKEKFVSGELNYDDHQYKLVRILQKLKLLVEEDVDKDLLDVNENNINIFSSNNSSNLNKPDTKYINETVTKISTNTINNNIRKQLKGLYIHGNVGTGKTMLMDIFYKHLNISKKCRMHFHEFMLDIHQRIHRHKKQLLALHGRDIHVNLSSERDSILFIAKEIATETKVLCFDEFQVTDICDAMILHRLFAALWTHGIILVATSNRPPSELYHNGLNRSYFLPFIKNLESYCIVRDILIVKDYRSDNISLSDSYFVPNNEINKQRLVGQFYHTLNKYLNPNSNNNNNNNNNNNFIATNNVVTIPVMMGRSLQLTHANLQAKICLVDFNSLCEVEKGAADYNALCSYFHTIYMYAIPTLNIRMHNEARRFITLIDAIYNQEVLFIWCADQHPSALLHSGSGEYLTLEENNEDNDLLSSSSHNSRLLGTDHHWMGDGCDNKPQIITNNNTNTSISNMILPGEKLLRDADLMKTTTIRLTKNNNNKYNNNNNHHNNTSTTTDNNNKDVADDVNMKVLDGELASIQELSFAFKRATSRLIEMSGSLYREKWNIRHNIK